MQNLHFKPCCETIHTEKKQIMKDIAQIIADELNVKFTQVKSAIQLLDDGATVPFIARYRKEATGELDDTQLRTLEERLGYLRELEERRTSILGSIKKQGKLTSELETAIQNTVTKTELEDLYLPYKRKRQTKAQIARAAGLEPLALALLENPGLTPEQEAEKYITVETAPTDTNTPDTNVPDIKAALDGARNILMERFSENAELLGEVRTFLSENAVLTSEADESKQKKGAKYRDYFEYREPLKRIPSHRALAVFRGQKEGVLQVSLTVEGDNGTENHPCETMVANHFNLTDQGRPADKWLREVVRWTWRVKIMVHLERDLLSNLREQAEKEAIRVFAHNLEDLLMAAPAGLSTTMGLDPGLRTGVKLAIVDGTGQLLDHKTIFPHAPKNQWDQSIKTLADLCKKHNVTLLSIGNGTASRETDKLVAELLTKHKEIKAQRVITNEAGASVYSASKLAAKEFPDLDVSFRGAVSIARRLQDPLAELVKIEPKSIGVGQYQHDVSQVRLARELDATVEDCVNAVGVDVNTASTPLLTKISGLNKTIAGNIVNFRNNNGPFKSREELKQVPRFGEKTFELAAGFLRIMNGANPLDRSSVHPEAYPVVKNISEQRGRNIPDMIGDAAFLKGLSADDYTSKHFGLPTVTDIISELEKPGRDPRPEFRTAELKEGVETLKDLKSGMILEGTVTNVTNFGAFIDIGVHQDGLVHISALSNQYVKDPRQVVKAGSIVTVKVVEVDQDRNRIGLSMRLDDEPAKKTTGNTPGKQPSRGKRKDIKTGKNTSQTGRSGTFADLFANAKKLKSK